MNLAEWIAAIAAAINAISVVVLVVITFQYASSTKAILEESRKAREASERQANAAQKNIEASNRQASAAQANVDFLKRQLEEQSGLGREMVQSAIDGAIGSIAYWRSLPLSDISRASSLPDPHDLPPQNTPHILEHARHVSPEVGRLVSEGFDNLGLARSEIERLKNANAAIPRGFYIDAPSKADAYLVEAFAKLQTARTHLA